MSKQHKVLWIIACVVILYSGFLSRAEAVPAYPGEVKMVQPSGEEFQARLNGDEWENWTSLSDTEAVVVQDEDGYWKYATVSFGELEPTDTKVGIDPAPPEVVQGSQWQTQLVQLSEEAKVPKFYFDSGDKLDGELNGGASNVGGGTSSGASGGPSLAVPVQPTGGPQKVLVLLVGFTNQAIKDTDSDWSNAFFGDTGATVKNFFKENSFNNFYFTPATESYGTANDGVVKVALNYAHPNPGASTGDANRLIVKNALIAADPYVDFASYDTNGNGYIENTELHIVTIVAGYDRSYDASGPSVWGHRWALFGAVAPPQLDGKFLGASGYGGYTQQGEYHGTHRATIGILCHELSHDLGAADLYDTGSGSYVVGASSLMDGGSWGRGPADYSGGSPAHLDPWHKQFLGFVSPLVVTSGTHSLDVASTGSYDVLRFNTSDANQYFLIENRNRTGFDNGLYYEGITNGGIAIWHIEENIISTYKFSNAVNNSGHNPGVWLEKSVSNSDPYYRNGGPKYTFGNTTTPNSKLYSGTSSGLELTVLDPSGDTVRVQIGSGVNSVGFSPTSYTVSEGGGSVSLTVTRTGDTSGPLTVNYATANGTASAGSDYTATSGTLSFAAGETSKTITVNILDDAIVESNETFTVQLSSASSGIIGASTATVTIQDNDCTVAFNPVTYTVSESTPNAVVTVTRTGTTSTAVTVDYATFDGTALAGEDYTAISGTLTFAAGQTTKTISIPIIDDSAYEGAESFSISLSNPTNGANLGASTATITISANDAPVVSFNPVTYTVNEGAGSVALTVVRIGDASGVLTVNYATANGTALAGSDYTATSGTLSFAAGEISKTITVNILDDVIAESNETFTVQLSSASGGTISAGTATVTIQDNECTVAFNPVTYTVSESTPNAVVTVTRTGATSAAVTVNYATADGTAKAGEDYQATMGTLSLAAGQTSKTILIPIIDDDVYEGAETFTITLANPTNGATLGISTATITIGANDAPVIGFNPVNYTIGEGDGSVNLTVVRTGDTSAAISVNYATSNSKAVAGSDFTAVSGTLTFVAGETSKTISVDVYDDTIVEGTESFTVNLSGVTGGATISNGTASVMIIDNEGGSGTVTALKISGLTAVGVGKTNALVLNGVLDDGGLMDITALAEWESSNPEVATVAGGAITGVCKGTTVITARYNGMSKTFLVSVR